jgi:hypothetical protein
VIWTCADCSHVVKHPVDGVNVIVDKHGNYWCVKCVEAEFFDGSFCFTRFPRRGRMVPGTILHEEER